jgi:hypothetical protein
MGKRWCWGGGTATKADPPALRKEDNQKYNSNTKTADDGGSGDASPGATEAAAELGGGFAVTEETESTEIIEVALAAAFGYGADVVGVP